MRAGRTRSAEVVLREVTLARHLAVRAAVGVGYVQGEGGDGPPVVLSALPDAALIGLIDVAVDGAPSTYADREALEALAARVWAAWLDEAERHVALGQSRARLVTLHTGMSAGGESLTEPPPPEMLAGTMTLPEWAACRNLLLWEAVMQTLAGASVDRFRKLMDTN